MTFLGRRTSVATSRNSAVDRKPRDCRHADVVREVPRRTARVYGVAARDEAEGRYVQLCVLPGISGHHFGEVPAREIRGTNVVVAVVVDVLLGRDERTEPHGIFATKSVVVGPYSTVLARESRAASVGTAAGDLADLLGALLIRKTGRWRTVCLGGMRARSQSGRSEGGDAEERETDGDVLDEPHVEGAQSQGSRRVERCAPLCCGVQWRRDSNVDLI
jgi:hypothetical protein